MKKVVSGLCCLAIALISISWAQAPRPSFEVASIKPNTSGRNQAALLRQPGGKFVATNATVKMLLRVAYQIQDFQIYGGPNWTDSDRFDIEAKAEDAAGLQKEELALMLQNLLADRFQLKTHTERKELSVYELVVGKGGAKLQVAPAPEPPLAGASPAFFASDPGVIPGTFRMGKGDVLGLAVPLANFVSVLEQQLSRKIVDKTGLSGFFNVKLHWTPDTTENQSGQSAENSGPSLFTALQEQLGLRLESAKGLVEVIVIDSAQKPSEN